MDRREVIDIVRQEFAQILLGQVAATDAKGRAKASRFGVETPFENTRMIQPFGLTSRPQAPMQSLVVPINGDPTHLVLVGQFDEGRPATEEGEACLYGADGQVVYMKTGGEVLIGSQAADEPAVLGNVLAEFLTALIDALLEAPQIGQDIVGPVFLDPALRAQLVLFKAQYLSTEATNILAQKTFVERGEGGP